MLKQYMCVSLCRQAEHVIRESRKGATDFWVNRPCVNQRPMQAIREHQFGRKTKANKHNQEMFRSGKRARILDVNEDGSSDKDSTSVPSHQVADRWLCEQHSMEVTLMIQLEKQKNAITKRLMAVDHIARNYHSFASYDCLVALLAQTGAFHDCPQWNEVGSFDSEGASYTTNW